MHLLVAFITRIQSVYSVLNGSNGILPKNSSQCTMHPEIWEGVMVVFCTVRNSASIPRKVQKWWIALDFILQ